MAFELQRSFAAGEISPSSWLRSDLGGMHAAAVKKMRNVIADPHGPAYSRLGFDFIEEIDTPSYCRIFDFDVDFSQSYALVVTTDIIYVLDRNGFQLSSDIVLNGDFADGSNNWIFNRTNFGGGTANIRPNGGNDDYIRQQVPVSSTTNSYTITVNGVGNTGGNPFEIRIGSAEGLFDLAQIQGVDDEFSATFTPGVASFWFEIFIPSGGSNKRLNSVSLVEIIATANRVEMAVVPPYTEQDILELHVDLTPGNDIMYLVTRGHEPIQVKFEEIDALNVWSIAPIAFSFGDDGAEPPIANPPVWGTEYPGTITFHDGRLVLGGTYSKPVTVWLSQPNDYTNFDLGDSSLSSSAMELPLSKHGEIQWLQSNTQLFVGLDTGEHVIFGTNGPLEPSNAQTEQHSAYGSSRAHAVVVDEQIMYIDTQGRTVRAMQFSDSQNSYISNNVTFQAEHITLGGLFEIEYGISPIGTMWFPNLLGDLVSASMEKDQGTLGWSRHDTQGNIISIALLKETGVDVPWIAVRRNDKLYIERYSVDDRAFMDSALRETVITPGTIFFGWDHLIGFTVQVIADGKVHPDRVVQPDGSIILAYDALEVTAGLGFTAEIETLPEQMDSNSGNSLNHTKRYTEIYAYLLNSPRPKINGFDSYLRNQSTSMGTREASETGIVTVGNDTGWDKEATITITQDLPLDMIISAIGGKLKENKI